MSGYKEFAPCPEYYCQTLLSPESTHCDPLSINSALQSVGAASELGIGRADSGHQVGTDSDKGLLLHCLTLLRSFQHHTPL